MKSGGASLRYLACSGILGGLAFFAPVMAQTTVTANPVADAFVTTGPSNNLVANNYGGAGALAISGPTAVRSGVGANGTFSSVMRFDLRPMKTSFDAAYGSGRWTVQAITLRLTTSSVNNAIFNDNASGQFRLVWMQNDDWTEGVGMPKSPDADGITQASLPAYLGAGDQSLGTFTFNTSMSGVDGTNSTYPLSLAGANSGLVNDVLGGRLASFELVAVTDSMSYLFNSVNFTMASRRPVLSVTVQAVPEPTPGLLLGVAAALLGVLRRRQIAQLSRVIFCEI